MFTSEWICNDLALFISTDAKTRGRLCGVGRDPRSVYDGTSVEIPGISQLTPDSSHLSLLTITTSFTKAQLDLLRPSHHSPTQDTICSF